MPVWLGWLLLVAGLMGLFVLWDMLFCGGERCRQMIDLPPLQSLVGRGRRRAKRRDP